MKASWLCVFKANFKKRAGDFPVTLWPLHDGTAARSTFPAVLLVTVPRDECHLRSLSALAVATVTSDPSAKPPLDRQAADTFLYDP